MASTDDELAALDALEKEGTWTVGGHEIRVTNLDKVLFTGARRASDPVTKRDLLRYHVAIAPTLVPYLDGHGLTVQRYPERDRAEGLLAEGPARATRPRG